MDCHNDLGVHTNQVSAVLCPTYREISKLETKATLGIRLYGRHKRRTGTSIQPQRRGASRTKTVSEQANERYCGSSFKLVGCGLGERPREHVNVWR